MSSSLSLKEFINQIVERVLHEEPEAPGAAFGKYAFDATRTDIPNNAKETETPVEQLAYQALHDYVGANQKEKLTQIAPLFLDLVKKGLYKPVLDPGVAEVYRILQLPQEEASKLINFQISAEQPAGVANGGQLKPVDGQVSGWTSNPKLISEFQGIGEGNTFLLFRAPTQGNNFFGRPGVVAVAAGEQYFAHELETIGYGPINYDRVAYVLMYDKTGKYFKGKESYAKLLQLIQQ